MTQDNSIVIREYLTTDKEVVMNLIKLNTPNFFAKEEVNDLSNYLDKGIELYYVLLVDGKVVGCGGINFAEDFNHGGRKNERYFNETVIRSRCSLRTSDKKMES